MMNRITICILNYNNDDNAVLLYREAIKYAKNVYILDSYHKEHGTAIECLQSGVIYYDNIQFGGLTIKAFDLSIENNSDYVVNITSDVIFEDKNFKKMIQTIKNIDVESIGVYEPSNIEGSCCLGMNYRTIYNGHFYCHKTNKLRNVDCGEGFVDVINLSLVKKLRKHINFENNKYGWGLNNVLCLMSHDVGLSVVIDDCVEVFHPSGTGYSSLEANAEYSRFMRYAIENICKPKITIGYCSRSGNENFKSYLRDYFGIDCQIIEKICNETTGLYITKAYNEILSESNSDIVILCHEDVVFSHIDKYNYTPYQSIKKIFDNNKDVAILGVSEALNTYPDIINKQYGLSCFFSESTTQLTDETFFNYGPVKPYTLDVTYAPIVDGCFMAVKKDMIKHAFDENNKKFHCYDIDFCLANFLDGVKIAVIKPFLINHYGTRSNWNEFEETLDYIRNKYTNILPINISSMEEFYQKQTNKNTLYITSVKNTEEATQVSLLLNSLMTPLDRALICYNKIENKYRLVDINDAIHLNRDYDLDLFGIGAYGVKLDWSGLFDDFLRFKRDDYKDFCVVSIDCNNDFAKTTPVDFCTFENNGLFSGR